MSRIKVFENFLHDSAPVEFPCYELDPTAISPLTTSDVAWTNPQEGQYTGMNRNFVFLDTANPNADFSAIFPDWQTMPHVSTESGSIIRSECKYELDTGVTYSIHDSGITAVPLGVKPDDWDSEWMYYGTMYTTPAAADTHYFFKIFTPLFGVNTTTTTVPDPASIWDSNTQYYKNEPSDHDYRLSRLFSTYNNGSFGVSAMQGGYDPAWPTKSPRAGGIAPRGSEYTYAFRNYPFWTMHGYSGNFASFNAHYYIPVPVPYTNTNAAGYIYGFNWGNDSISTPMLEYRNQMFIFVHFIYNDIEFWGVALLNMSDNTSNAYPTGVRVMAFSETFWGDSIIPDEPPGREENFGDDSTWAGGNGTFTDVSDNRGDDNGTYISTMASNINTALNGIGVFNASTTHSFNIYKMTNQFPIPSLLNHLFSTSQDSLIEKFRETQFNPISAILSFNLMPSGLLPVESEDKKNVTACGYNFSDPTLSDYVPVQPTLDPVHAVNVGKFEFTHYFDAYPDFAPFTKAYLHLPYCGVLEIDINAVMYGWLSVDYLTDVLNGNVTAFVTCCDRNGRTQILYTVSGNCAYSLPLFSESQNAETMGKNTSKLIAAASIEMGSAISGVNLGSLSSKGMATSVGESFIQYGLAGTHKRHTQFTGSISGNNCMISDTVVWIEIVRPEWVNPSTYADIESIPAEIGGTIFELGCMGKTVISNAELDDINCTDTEKNEILKILREGILILPEPEPEPEPEPNSN